MAGKSQAIWINNDRNRGGSARDSTSSDGPFSPPYSSSFGRVNLFGIQRSMSVASDGTAQNSPPNYYQNDAFESSPYAGRQRTRTYSFSGNSDEDWSSGQLSSSAPGTHPSWKRSNSVSYAADKNLARIDEHSSNAAFPAFGNAIKKSMDKLFNPEQSRKLSFATGGEIKKKNEQVKDRVVSMLTSM